MAQDKQITKQVEIPAELTVKEFAAKIGVGVGEVIAQLMKNGVMATINDVIDFDTAAIVADDLGFELLLQAEQAETGSLGPQPETTELAAGEGETRPPVVAVMGHVDHGKTTLLDAIRTSDVASSEAGGITQHIGAYQITHSGREVTFLDTPGHEAFSILRQHGARLTDVAIIVVAADDGIKPQTLEAIEFAKAAGVKIVVAINKIDKPDSDTNRCKQQLAEQGLNPEEWGGETVMVEVSAKEGKNIDKLLDVVLLVADIEDLRARTEGTAEGIIVESHMATGMGAVTTLLVEHGQLKTGDFLVAGKAFGKVRSLTDTLGRVIKLAQPGTPAVVSGWKEMPLFGERFFVVESEKKARQKAAAFRRSASQAVTASKRKVTEQDEIMTAIAAGKTSHTPVIVKADVQGSLESVVKSIEELGSEEVAAKVVAQGVGDVSEGDIAQAESSQAIVIGFNVGIKDEVKQLAARSGVKVALYEVIYELLDELKAQLSAQLEPEIVEEVVGSLEVKGIFRITKTSLICGGLVKKGKISPGFKVRVATKDEPGEEIGTVKNVQREQETVSEVSAGVMCGLNIDTSVKATVAEGDLLEFFTVESKPREL